MHFNYQIIFDKNTEKELKKNVSEDLGLSETSFSLYFSNFRTLWREWKPLWFSPHQHPQVKSAE